MASPAWRTRLSPEDLRGLTPLIRNHLNPYGTFFLDMDARLDLAGEGGEVAT